MLTPTANRARRRTGGPHLPGPRGLLLCIEEPVVVLCCSLFLLVCASGSAAATPERSAAPASAATPERSAAPASAATPERSAAPGRPSTPSWDQVDDPGIARAIEGVLQEARTGSFAPLGTGPHGARFRLYYKSFQFLCALKSPACLYNGMGMMFYPTAWMDS